MYFCQIPSCANFTQPSLYWFTLFSYSYDDCFELGCTGSSNLLVWRPGTEIEVNLYLKLNILHLMIYRTKYNTFISHVWSPDLVSRCCTSSANTGHRKTFNHRWRNANFPLFRYSASQHKGNYLLEFVIFQSRRGEPRWSWQLPDRQSPACSVLVHDINFECESFFSQWAVSNIYQYKIAYHVLALIRWCWREVTKLKTSIYQLWRA